MRPVYDAAFARVAERFAALRTALEMVPADADRRIARDALRDALDRDADLDFDRTMVAGSFTVLRTLHRGPHHEVLLLRQRDAGTLHALKAPLAEHATEPLLRRLLLAEAANQGRIRHPACLPLGALLRLSDGRPALLTDHVDAPTLAGLLMERTMEQAKAIALGIRLATALSAIHDAGIVHGDLTPRNVFVPGGDPSAALVFDFGLSRTVGAPCEDDLKRGFTPAFAAPEIRAGSSPADPSTDLFSLGRLISAAAGSSAGPSLARLLANLQCDEPKDRYAGAASVADALATCGFEDTRS